MAGQDSLTVTRRALDVEDYIDIARRHKAWIFGPTFAALVIAVVVAFLWPDTYLSTAIIRVVPPQVPETYVPPNITTDMQGRINGLTQVILNRASLTALVNKYMLYRKELSRSTMEDVVENMKKNDIVIGQVQTFAQNSGDRQIVPAFRIGFQYSNRMTAYKVTQDLVASFIAESMNEATSQVIGTTELLQAQWNQAKQRLDECDAKLQAFRVQNLGRLPDDQQANYQQLNALQAQMINVDAQMQRIQSDKLQIDNEMRIARQRLAQLKDPNSDPLAIDQKNEKLAAKDKEIEAAENYLARLRERYKDTYPDVQSTVQQLKLLRKQRDDILKEAATAKTDVPRALPPNPQYVKERADTQATISRLAALQESKDLMMKDLQKQSEQITASLKNYQSRIEQTPLGQKEWSELMSNRELAWKDFQDADQKLNMSKKAQDVAKRQEGEKLQILDPPNIPQTPTQPKRPFIILVGTGIGLALGILLAGAREVKNTSLKNLKDVRAYTQLQVLGSIPLLENDLVVRRRRRLGWLAWSTACLVGVAIMTSSVAYYYATKL